MNTKYHHNKSIILRRNGQCKIISRQLYILNGFNQKCKIRNENYYLQYFQIQNFLCALLSMMILKKKKLYFFQQTHNFNRVVNSTAGVIMMLKILFHFKDFIIHENSKSWMDIKHNHKNIFHQRNFQKIIQKKIAEKQVTTRKKQLLK